MARKFISVTETAKIIRGELKTAFSKTKFSVRSSSYSGGASICVSWSDGPAESKVSAIVKQFEGSSFDGYTDSKNYHHSTYNGEEVYFGADYVNTERKTSRLFVEVVTNAFCAYWGYDRSKVKINGSPEHAYADAWSLGHNVEQELNRLLRDTDEKNAHRPYEAKNDPTEQAAKAKAKAQADAARKAREEQKRQQDAEAQKRADEQKQKQREQQEKYQYQYREQQKKANSTSTLHKNGVFGSRENALKFLGLTFYATDAQIKEAFLNRVKAASNGKGGYTEDMDVVVKAKKKALSR